MTLIGSIAGRGAAGTLFVVRGPTGWCIRGVTEGVVVNRA